MSSLADYLAKNYLTADPKPSKKTKKRKRKDAAPAAGLVIADDDATGWEKPAAPADAASDDEDVGPIVANTRSAEFRSKKSSAWTTLAAPPSTAAPTDDDAAAAAAAADAIILAAAQEREAADAEQDEAPAVVGGLQTGAQVRAEAARAARQEKARIKASAAAEGPADTIYRDASGRVISVAMARAAARRAAEEKEAREKEDRDAARGEVQLMQREERAKELAGAKYLTIGRSADDVEMNEELKARERWADPAFGFVSTGGKGRKKEKGYQGAFEPNRHGIRPGARWDGVDRSSGFEKKWFAARNRQKDRAAMEYQWQMDE
jgi:pre-mRNA-splicing factor CWC26